MSITIDFKKEYADLIREDIPKIRCESYPHRNSIPDKHQKKFIHPENGFVKKYCEDYDDELGERNFDK